MSRTRKRKVEMLLEKLPRTKLACLPTPLEYMPSLSKRLNCPNLFIKRDDLISLAFGGTKIRALEYILGEPKAKNADIIIVCGSIQGNWPLEVVAAAKRLGKQAIVVTRDPAGYYPPRVYDSNLLLDELMGAEIKVIVGEEARALELAAENLAKGLREKGQKPYIALNTSLLWVAGMVNAISELLSQAEEEGIVIDHIVHASADGRTQAGLILGARAFDTQIKVMGVSVGHSTKTIATQRIEELVNAGAQFLGIDVTISPDDVILFDDYVGNGHGLVDEKTVHAIRFAAETEGIFLDPIYTGKAMAGLIDLIRRGYFKAKDNVVFIHTGGVPMLLAYREPITDILESRKPVWIKPPWIP